MINLIICDGDGTLKLPNDDAEIQQLRNYLIENDIHLGVVTNESEDLIRERFRQAGLAMPDSIVAYQDLKEEDSKVKQKPSPVYVNKILDDLGIDKSEAIYLCDSQITDVYCAINSGVLPISANYSTSITGNSLQYALPIYSVEGLKNFLEIFGDLDEPYFGWEYIADNIDIRCVLFQHAEIRDALKKVLKYDSNITFSSGLTARNLIYITFLSQLYFSGLVHEVDLITSYPSSNKGHQNPAIIEFLKSYVTMLPCSAEELILRHKDANSAKRGNRNFLNQINTIRLIEKFQDRITNKTVLVLDDFSTTGTSLEAARNLLLKGGASKVICVAFGKFRNTYKTVEILSDYDPYKEISLTDSDIDISISRVRGSNDAFFYDNILPYFRS